MSVFVVSHIAALFVDEKKSSYTNNKVVKLGDLLCCTKVAS